MINTDFNITDWKKDSLVSFPMLTPYDALYLIDVREQVKLLEDLIRYIRAASSRPVSSLLNEFISIINSNGLQNRIKVNRNALEFIYEVYGPPWELEFYWIIKMLKETISEMDPTSKYRSCPKCSNLLVLTGYRMLHYSKTLHYYCLDCCAIYEWYRKGETEEMIRKYRLNTERGIE